MGFCPLHRSTTYFLLIEFCQKYLPSEHILESEDGHFSPLGEGVKYLPTPHILHFSVK